MADTLSKAVESAQAYDFTIVNANIKKDDGIEAEATVTSNNSEGGNAVVIFKLIKNDRTVIGLFSNEMYIEDSSVFRVKFHGYSGDEYKVKVYVWDKLNSSIEDVGKDLAEPVEIQSPTTTETSVYYIDFENGDDSNQGTSVNSAWKHCPGDANATGIPLAHKPAPGDTFRFKGGVEYKGKIELKYTWSGIEGSPIVFDGNSDGRWGHGKAILDGDNRNYDKAIGMLSHWQNGGLSYVEIRSFIIQGYSKYGITCGSSSNVSISDILIHNLSNWDLSQTAIPIQGDARSGGGISLGGNSKSISIDNVEITKVSGIGIGIYDGTQDVDINNVRIHDYIVWQIDIAPRPNMTVSNISIHDSRFYNVYHYSNRYWSRALIGTESHQHLQYT